MAVHRLLSILVTLLSATCALPTPEGNIHPDTLAAMKRDLGLDGEQVYARVAQDLKASKLIEQVQAIVGDTFGGAWIAADKVYVGITDPANAAKVATTGATPIVVSNSLSKLNIAKSAVDNTVKDPGKTVSYSGIASWYVDVITNKVVIEALDDSHGEAKALATRAGLNLPGEVEVRTVAGMPVLYASTVIGGDIYYIGTSSGPYCSVGFSVTTGYVSAGHCNQGTNVYDRSRQLLGMFANSTFPGSADMSHVKTVTGTVLRGVVRASGTTQSIQGSTESAIGSSVCRSGSTSGYHCGKITQKNATVNYGGGDVVTGLTKTDACAEPGDSGGPFFTGGQAQGVTSGGNGNCDSGGNTYFQPVNEILQTYGLTLVRS